MDNKPRRFNITLPGGLARALARLAEAEGNKATSLANYLVEKALRDLMQEGKIPLPALPKKYSIAQLLTEELTALTKSWSGTEDPLPVFAKE